MKIINDNYTYYVTDENNELLVSTHPGHLLELPKNLSPLSETDLTIPQLETFKTLTKLESVQLRKECVEATCRSIIREEEKRNDQSRKQFITDTTEKHQKNLLALFDFGVRMDVQWFSEEDNDVMLHLAIGTSTYFKDLNVELKDDTVIVNLYNLEDPDLQAILYAILNEPTEITDNHIYEVFVTKWKDVKVIFKSLIEDLCK